VNHTASTNGRILRLPSAPKPYNGVSMSNQTPIDQITERVERLLVRYDELQRTNALLTTQLESLTQERDSLKSRLNAARSRVDALLERFPDTVSMQKDPS
jgi:cell division protein ZapB